MFARGLTNGSGRLCVVLAAARFLSDRLALGGHAVDLLSQVSPVFGRGSSKFACIYAGNLPGLRIATRLPVRKRSGNATRLIPEQSAADGTSNPSRPAKWTARPTA